MILLFLRQHIFDASNKLTNFWLMYKVRFAGGRVASELQLIDNLSPIKYLKKQNFQSHHQLYLVWSPVLGPVDPGPVLGDDHD